MHNTEGFPRAGLPLDSFLKAWRRRTPLATAPAPSGNFSPPTRISSGPLADPREWLSCTGTDKV